MEVAFALSLIKRVLEKMFFLLKITCLNIFSYYCKMLWTGEDCYIY